MQSLERKLWLSYGPLIIVLIAVGVWGVFNVGHLKRSVDAILVNNYKSILAASEMKHALDGEDSACILYLAGRKPEASAQFHQSLEDFQTQLTIAQSNITELGEDKNVADIKDRHLQYASLASALISDHLPAESSASPSNYYFNRIAPASAQISASLETLLKLNQDAMFSTKQKAVNESIRAQISTEIVAVLGLILVLLLAWRFTSYVVSPVKVLAEKARSIAEGNYDQHIEQTSSDEIGTLAAEFNRMAVRLRDLQRSDYARLLMEKRQADAVINSICDPVIVTDSFGTVTKLNQAATTLLGEWASVDGNGHHETSGYTGNLPTAEFGKKILRMVHETVSMQRQVSDSAQEMLVPVMVDGNERSYRPRITPMRDSDGRLIGAVTLLEDVTFTSDVERIKAEFISVAANKLRDPMQSLKLALYTLSQGHVGEMSEKQEELLGVAVEDAGQLDAIVDDLVEITALDSHSKFLNIEPVRPVDLVRPVVARYQAAAETKHITLKTKVFADLPRVMADKDATKRIFDNLFSNAIRHTGHDGVVTLEAWERGSSVFFSVNDTGEGIPQKFLPTLFSSFVNVPRRSHGGTGLGLALVKRLVEAQNGQISVESQPGEGTTFIFSLSVSAGPITA